MKLDDRVRSLSMPLPEDILKRKWGGDLEGAIRAIDLRLETELPDLLRARLVCERERIRRLPTQYPWNREQAVAKMLELAPKMTEADFDALEMAGRIDFIFINGEKRYFVRFHRTIVKAAELAHIHGRTVNPVDEWLDPMVDKIMEKGELAYRITLDSALQLDADAFVPGEYLAHLPFPAKNAQQSDIRLLEGAPDGMGAEDAHARTVWWRKHLDQWEDFRVKYSYVSRIRYADPLHQPAPAQPLYPDARPVEAADLSEQEPYILFTPYLRQLAADLAAGETEPVRKAWKFYEFVTTKVKYSFMRDYFQVDNLGEYCAVNLKGDCGLQALLFIILCRIAGIPARWQSGLSVEPDYVGSHDWAQFYLEGWGWLFADCSYGGSAFRCGSEKRHAFYFGNLCPMRMAANRSYQAEIEPALTGLRVDPFDNQSGELERIGAEYPFNGRQTDNDITMTSFEEV